MTGGLVRRLGRDRRGAAVVEFALISPALFGFIFLILEVGRMAWTQQVLQETAVSAARCLGLKASGCATASVMPDWAAARARVSGVAIAAQAVQATAGTSCDARPGMSRIVITSPYANAVGRILPAARANLVASACFPEA